jgi:predicted aldo/keto reductase-like oxidoreductase
MTATHGSCDGSSKGSDRRRFLGLAATTAVAANLGSSSVRASSMPVDQDAPLPSIVLGKTGATVSRLGMGTSWTVQPSFVQAAIAAGVKYIDTSESYENGTVERTLGTVFERTGQRKDVFLVTKNTGFRLKADPVVFEQRLRASLDRLKTDYTDAYYLHGLQGAQIPLLFDAGVKKAFEDLKKAGKIRYAGLSCHDSRLVDVIEAAAKCGWIDQIMIQYNYRTMNSDAIKRAIDAASAAKLGIIAMKTQGGAGEFREGDANRAFTTYLDKGFKKEQAAIKAVFADERIHVVVSEMTNRDMLKDNMAASKEPLTAKQASQLEQHRQMTSRLYCHGCGHLCETAAKGVPVATVLRYLRYYSVYGKRAEARALYQALPPVARDLAQADLAAAERACPHGLAVTELVQIADRKLGS